VPKVSDVSKPAKPAAENRLFLGDNLDVLRHQPRYIDNDSVDLIYLDPPFKSGKDYNLLFKSETGVRPAALIQAFDDTWAWDEVAKHTYDELLASGGDVALALEAFRRVVKQSSMLAYLSMMAARLIEMRRVLKPTGSLYLHCDPTASHYLKVLLDGIFGPTNFRSELVWKRSSAHSGARKYGPVHDVLLLYTKTDSYTWNPIYQPLPTETADAWYNNVEESTGRRFNRADLTASGIRTGASGQAWRGIDVTKKGRHWAIPGFVASLLDPKMTTQESLDALDAAGRIFWPQKATGMPMMKRYLDESKGIPAQDVITDISMLNNVDAERMGYPTQKPLALLERIILASSNEGDVVMDPFCGCGTAIHASLAVAHPRRWIGIDITDLAIDVIEERLVKYFGPTIRDTYNLTIVPKDEASARRLALQDRTQFEHWAVTWFHAETNVKKGADRGIDGLLTFLEPGGGGLKKIIFSVKSGFTGPAHVRELAGVVEHQAQAEMGVLIILKPITRPMRQAALDAGRYIIAATGEDYPRVQIITVADMFAGETIEAPTAALRKPPRAATPPPPSEIVATPQAVLHRRKATISSHQPRESTRAARTVRHPHRGRRKPVPPKLH
jgi:DNA modification methylase